MAQHSSPRRRRPLPFVLAATVAASALVAAAAVGPAVAAEPGGVVVNEVATDTDWVELTNTSSTPVDVSGYVLKDDTDSRTLTVPAGTTLAPGAFVTVDVDVNGGFGLGKADQIRVFLPDGQTLVDGYAWTAHPATTYGRCPDGTGAFTLTTTVTKGAANDCGAPEPEEPVTPSEPIVGVVVNEVESNGDDTDWVELYNTTSADIDLSGALFRDDDATRTPYALPAGSILPASGFFVIDQLTATQTGFDFGLGNVDEANLIAADGTTPIASYAWQTHAAVTYGRCPDGTGELRVTSASTKGTPNDCSLPVRINEVESSGGTPGDWVELTNVGTGSVDLGGLVLTDSDPAHVFEVPAGTTLAAGGFVVLRELVDGAGDFDFGLGAADSVRLLSGGTVVDEVSWSSHAAVTLGRCPDGSGEFAVTAQSTPGAANVCEDVLNAQVWPGGASVEVLDDEAMFEGDLSGLDVDGDVLWAVDNGNGILHRLIPDEAGVTAADGWTGGRTLRYPDGSGTVDAEGVTVTDAGAAGGVYVSSERDNTASSVSRPAVLRYDVSGTGGELTATDEWNLAPDFPGLGANQGLEGITWIPDTALVAAGLVDQRTSAPYDPAALPGHGNGLFFVGVEGTASVYAYALNADGTTARIAAIATGFTLVADVQFDPERGVLWVACDEACGGEIATYEIGPDGAFAATALYARPAGMANLANEGFAIAPQSACVDGRKPTYYADDADTDGFSLRRGSIDCTVIDEEPGTEEPGTGEPGAGEPGTGEPGAGEPGTGEPGAGEPGTGEPGTGLPSTGAPEPIDDALLTDANRGGLTGPGSAEPGETVEFELDGSGGRTLRVWLHSDPQLLATVVTAPDGSFAVTIPADAPLGAHRVVVTDTQGELVGWTELTIAEAALAATGQGAGLDGTAAVGGLALLAGLVAVALRRRIRSA